MGIFLSNISSASLFDIILYTTEFSEEEEDYDYRMAEENIEDEAIIENLHIDGTFLNNTF